MALELPLDSRATIETEAGRTVVTMPPSRQWFSMLFLAVWLVGWAWGEASVIRQLLGSTGSSRPLGFLLLWLTAWTVGGCWVLATLLWQLFGAERLTLGQGRVKLSYRALGIGRDREFDQARTSNWRVAPSVGNAWVRQGQAGAFGMGNSGSIAFRLWSEDRVPRAGAR